LKPRHKHKVEQADHSIICREKHTTIGTSEEIVPTEGKIVYVFTIREKVGRCPLGLGNSSGKNKEAKCY
jgi:hypothetical protein